VIVFDLGASGQRLILDVPVVQHLEAHRQFTSRHREAGGQLFATFSGGDVAIREATGPRRTDLRTRTSYRPDRRAEQQEILERHARGLHYVGDWHTHPSPRPLPSGLDYLSIQQAVRASNHQLNGFVLIVVGTLAAPDGFHVSVNEGSRAFVLSVSEAVRWIDGEETDKQ
jgi:integrative and conjugative element protein (TIGR02256 family)